MMLRAPRMGEGGGGARDGRGRQVLAELGAYDADVAMGPHHLRGRARHVLHVSLLHSHRARKAPNEAGHNKIPKFPPDNKKP